MLMTDYINAVADSDIPTGRTYAPGSFPFANIPQLSRITCNYVDSIGSVHLLAGGTINFASISNPAGDIPIVINGGIYGEDISLNRNLIDSPLYIYLPAER